MDERFGGKMDEIFGSLQMDEAFFELQWVKLLESYNWMKTACTKRIISYQIVLTGTLIKI